MGFLKDVREFCDSHGYMSNTCRIHGRFFTDSGDGCPFCEDDTEEDDEDTEES